MKRRNLWIAGVFCAFAASSIAAATQAAPAQPNVVTFALLSDTHVNEAKSGDEANYTARFQRVIADVNAAHVSAVLVAGDLTQSGKSEQITDFATLVKGFEAPVCVVEGNHDVGPKLGVKDAKPGSGVTAARVMQFETAFGPSYYARTVAGVKIVAFNTPILGSGLPVEAAQWEFLEKELAPSKTPILMLTHYPLYQAKADEAGGTYWNVEPAPRARLLALIAGSGGVLAVLSGHLHHPLENTTPGGVLLYTTPPVSFGLPKGKQAEGWTLVTVTPETGKVQTEFRAIPH
ncbi:MAG: metallophosphoesterase [Capsulimonas sp.]|uniref:metallophosphoesterase family protein n=1 Tax=Capsulimonas sp. TaxID=2494211 RepID=UPI003264B84C